MVYSWQNKASDKELWAWSTWKNIAARAETNHLPFNLHWEDIETPDYCSILFLTLLYDRYRLKTRQDALASVDRIIPSLGYIRGNIQTISWKANRIKRNRIFHNFEIMRCELVKRLTPL